jgi:type II secretory pathway pseudopilin PulG
MSKIWRMVSHKMELKPTNKRSSQGFTIIEALASAVILALTVLGVINLFPVSSAMNARAERRNEAMLLTEDRIEEFRFLGFLCVEDTIIAGFTTGADTFGQIIRNWNLTLNGTLIEVDISCAWPTPGGIGTISRERVMTLMSNDE